MALNNSIIPNNDAEKNQQTVNGIVFTKKIYESDTTHWKKRYVYNQNEKTTLYAVAMQNPLLAGEAVYQAKTMLWIDVATPSSKPNSRTNPSSKSPAKASNYKLYPNPNSGTMTIDYTIDGGETALFSIYSMDGRLLQQQTLNAQNNTATVDATILKAGIYYYTVKEENKNAKTDKIVIVK